MIPDMAVRFELFVADYEVAIDFYTRVLGFELRSRDDQYVSLACGSVTLGLGRVADLPERTDGAGFSQERLARERGAGVEIVLVTAELDRLYQRVADAGWLLAEPMRTRPWGLRDFRLTDPDGYYLRLTSPVR
jgi:lactoylglutathione lyase